MPFPNQTIVDQVSKKLWDEIGANYDQQTELLPGLNDSIVEIVWLDPMASVFNMPFPTEPVSLQTIPADAVALINVKANLGTDGTTVTNAITRVPRDHFDSVHPNWQSEVSGAAGVPASPYHYIFDERDPRRFWLWPAPIANWKVQLEYSQVPDDVTLADDYPLPAMYIPATKDYMLWKALLRRDKAMVGPMSEQLLALATKYESAFYTLMGATVKAIGEVVPRRKANP